MIKINMKKEGMIRKETLNKGIVSNSKEGKIEKGRDKGYNDERKEGKEGDVVWEWKRNGK